MPLLTYALWWAGYNPNCPWHIYLFTSSVFYETLRMFPSVRTGESFQSIATKSHDYYQVINIPKLSEEDTTLTVGNAAGEKLTIPVLKGVRIIIDSPGLHYNRKRSYYSLEMFILTDLFWLIFFVARYWKDPHSFKPARFLEDWPRDAFIPFSAGECWQRCFSTLLLF